MKISASCSILFLLIATSCASSGANSALETKLEQQQVRIEKLEKDNSELAALVEKQGMRMQEIYEQKASYDKTDELEAQLKEHEDAINRIGRTARSAYNSTANHYGY